MNWQHMILNVEYGTIARWVLGIYIVAALTGAWAWSSFERACQEDKKAPADCAKSSKSRPNRSTLLYSGHQRLSRRESNNGI